MNASPYDGGAAKRLSPASETARPPVPSQVLSSLSPAAFALLEPSLRGQSVAKGTVLWEADRRSERVYFPLSGLISVASVLDDGEGIEVACVGREGAGGIWRGPESFTRGVAQCAGTLLAIPAARLASLAAENAELRDMISSCNEWMLLQAQQTAACNAAHDVERRLARWILQVADRAGDAITSTQEEIARLLGVRRTTLTLVANRLQDHELITCRRGLIVVRNRPRLEALACSCYHRLALLRSPSARAVNQRSETANILRTGGTEGA